MKGFERMRKMKINHGLHGLASLTLAMLGMVWAANAATGMSAAFRMDLSGMGPWEMRTARASATLRINGAQETIASIPYIGSTSKEIVAKFLEKLR